MPRYPQITGPCLARPTPNNLTSIEPYHDLFMVSLARCCWSCNTFDKSLEGWPTKAKEAPSPHEIRQTLMGTNLVFLCLWDNQWWFLRQILIVLININSELTQAELVGEQSRTHRSFFRSKRLFLLKKSVFPHQKH